MAGSSPQLYLRFNDSKFRHFPFFVKSITEFYLKEERKKLLKMGWANPNLDREMKKNLESKVEDFLSSGKGK